MATAESRVTKSKSKVLRRVRVVRSLDIDTDDVLKTVRSIRQGFSFKSMAKFQKTTGLSWAEISRFVGIPLRTLTRRQNQGRLLPDESDRLLRASAVFDMAVELFEGDVAGARKWLQNPKRALGGEIPLDFASTEIGAYTVKNIIGRLEHGVFT
ncbi:MAG: DUF2384 domain-containing protein [Phycisphaerales bacterium]|nr:DUF2384 domain-containing protein [Phycisphaerales bacterium]